jgi:hypothetical protein
VAWIILDEGSVFGGSAGDADAGGGVGAGRGTGATTGVDVFTEDVPGTRSKTEGTFAVGSSDEGPAAAAAAGILILIFPVEGF